ncbi:MULTISPECIES: hypothetical protein [unclassified Streptomyces]|uniref:hypothetical protein n=1 Tax=unclassified Streptomyces TaxID=2593676 RepID=UPI003D8F6A6E
MDNPISKLAKYLHVPRDSEKFDAASRIISARASGDEPAVVDLVMFDKPTDIVAAIVSYLRVPPSVGIAPFRGELAAVRALAFGEQTAYEAPPVIVPTAAVAPNADEGACNECDEEPLAGRRYGVCSTPGCGCRINTTPRGDNRCKGCRRVARAKRADKERRTGHADTEWRAFSARYLVGKTCECDDCLLMPSVMRPAATVLNHRDGLGPNGPKGYLPSNLQPMTAAHHNKLTAREQPGGWNDREA